VRVVHPEPVADVELDGLYGVARTRVGDRPWVGVCMIAGLDGTTVVDGASGALGNDTDRAVFAALRRAADVVIVGAGTVRAEGYGPPRKAGQRIGVVTSTARVDAASELYTSGAGFLVLPDDGPPAPVGPTGPIDVVRAGRGRVDIAEALRRLDTVLVQQPTFVQCEGGATLNGALLAAGCVDELDLTVAPVMAGGDGPRLTVGAPPGFERFVLAHVGVDEQSYLFTRWTRPW
jgi:riboflavin biosynthesis pyrimidine reductase